jgi:DNA-binding LacI/PurR family transcriptional regulator
VVFLDLGPVGKHTSNIRVDYSKGIYQAIDHLRALGHQDICFIAGPQTLRSAVTRRKAFVDALNQWNLPSHRTLEGNHKVDGGIHAVQTLLALPPLPTAILCSNDLTALGALKALAEAGVRVPEQVSVVGFDDIDFAHFTHPALTTVGLPRERLGQLAFDALGKILRSKSREGAEYVMETRLVIRDSTAPANTTALWPVDSSFRESRQEQPAPQAIIRTSAKPSD